VVNLGDLAAVQTQHADGRIVTPNQHRINDIAVAMDRCRTSGKKAPE
jgi:hypothetical protein